VIHEERREQAGIFATAPENIISQTPLLITWPIEPLHRQTGNTSFVLHPLCFALSVCRRERLTGTTSVLLSEEDELGLVVDGQDTGTGNTTEDVGTSTLEERLDTLSGDNLAGSIHGTVVLDGLTRGHHHTTADSVKRVRGDTGTSGDGPTEEERGEEVALKVASEENGLERVVHTEVQTTVDDDTSDGGHETTVETGNTVGSEGLLVDIDQAVELALTRALGGLGVVGKTGTGVVERVDEGEGSGTGSLGGGQLKVKRYGRACLELTPPEARLPIIHLA
jgi:hypothetical protein